MIGCFFIYLLILLSLISSLSPLPRQAAYAVLLHMLLYHLHAQSQLIAAGGGLVDSEMQANVPFTPWLMNGESPSIPLQALATDTTQRIRHGRRGLPFAIGF